MNHYQSPLTNGFHNENQPPPKSSLEPLEYATRLATEAIFAALAFLFVKKRGFMVERVMIKKTSD